MPRFAKTILVDSGFWLALYDQRDAYHRQAIQRDDVLLRANILIPWPSLYETFNTRFAKNMAAVKSFEALLRQPHVELLVDEPYRLDALDIAFSMSVTRSRPMSLVDAVIRLILEDVSVLKHGLLTFNAGDFTDLCGKHRIELL